MGSVEPMPRKPKRPAELPPLAQYLTDEMLRANLSLVDVEARSGIPDSTLSRIFSGEVKDPKASQVARIAIAIGVPVWKVMARAGLTDERPADPDAEAQRLALLLADEPDAQSLMKSVLQLGPRDRRAIRKYAEMLRQKDAPDSLESE